MTACLSSHFYEVEPCQISNIKNKAQCSAIFVSVLSKYDVLNIHTRVAIKPYSILFMVSYLCFFATLNKEQNSSYLQLSRRLNSKMLVLGVSIFQKYTHSPTKNAKKPTSQRIAFFAYY